MIRIDLITGFLGSGKTTFIRRYAKHLLDAGERICILENDFGAINVDRVLLNDLTGENCGMEMIVGGDGSEAHQRRMRTKLIAMAMNGYQRIIIEPSGVFDIDELFDLLYEDPIDRMYEMGNVLTIVDAGLPGQMSAGSEYMLASQCACAGRLILSRTQLYDKTRAESVIAHINSAMAGIGSRRRFVPESDGEVRPWEELTEDDYDRLAHSGNVRDNFVKQQIMESGQFASFFCFHLEVSRGDLEDRIAGLFSDPACDGIFRVKGYMHTAEGEWIMINATRERVEIEECPEAQNVIIIIGEKTDTEAVGRYFPVNRI